MGDYARNLQSLVYKYGNHLNKCEKKLFYVFNGFSWIQIRDTDPDSGSSHFFYTDLDPGK